MTLIEQIWNRIRFFNKRVTNPLLGRLAQRSSGSFAIVHHHGRKSGRAYQTPIMAFPSAGGFLIALTYGPKVDWYRNLRANQAGQIRWHQQIFDIFRIKPMAAEEALPRFPQPQKAVLGLMGLEGFALLKTDPVPGPTIKERK